MGGSGLTFQRQGGDKGLKKDREVEWKNKERDGNLRDRERDWGYRNSGWRERYNDRDHYVPPQDRSKPKETNANPESFRIKDMLARILNKVEGSDKVLKKMKTDFTSLNQTITSHSTSIKKLETQIGHTLAHQNPGQKKDSKVIRCKFEELYCSMHGNF